MVKTMITKSKKGFSLFEACVVMIIVAIFVAVMANVVAHKPKAKVASEAHGRFECYYEDGTLYQQMFTEKSTSGRQKAESAGGTATTCKFTPPNYAKYMIVDVVGGGAGGSAYGSGGEGEFSSTFHASVHSVYEATPGRGGAVGAGGGSSVVKANGVELVTVNGGKAVASLDNTTIDDVLSCTITERTKVPEYDCEIYPVCEVKNGMIEVSFCRTSGFYKTSKLTYKAFNSAGSVILNNPRYIVNNIYTTVKSTDPNTWVYHDISLFSDYNDDTNPVYLSGWTPDVDNQYTPSLYTMELKMNTRAGGLSENPSNLANLINSMQYSSKIKDAKVGTGGAPSSKGYDGAVLFLW